MELWFDLSLLIRSLCGLVVEVAPWAASWDAGWWSFGAFGCLRSACVVVAIYLFPRTWLTSNYLLGAFGGAGGGVEGRTLIGAGGLTFIPSLPTRTTKCSLGLLSFFIQCLLGFKELNQKNIRVRD